MVDEKRPIRGEVLSEELRLTLRDVCHICGTSEDIVIEMVREGVVEPVDSTPAKWRFSGVAVARIQTALRLQRDLEVNLPGAALALDLLEEIERLKRRMRQ